MRTFAGLSLDRPLVMGIVNVTPDSFSDGGAHDDPAAALDHARRLAAEGADILDLGAESTRPGAAPIPADEQLARLLPVVRGLAGSGVRLSIDTRSAVVLRACMAAGAHICNDVSALEDDPAMPAACADTGAAVVLMHKRGQPATMQRNTAYADVVAEVRAHLAARIAACRAAGLHDLAVDPGIGFGKTVDGNLALLRHPLDLGVPVLVGVSRKSFIGRLTGVEVPRDRLPGSLAAALFAVGRGADIVRVHDVAATVQALAVWQALRNPA